MPGVEVEVEPDDQVPELEVEVEAGVKEGVEETGATTLLEPAHVDMVGHSSQLTFFPTLQTPSSVQPQFGRVAQEHASLKRLQMSSFAALGWHFFWDGHSSQLVLESLLHSMLPALHPHPLRRAHEHASWAALHWSYTIHLAWEGHSLQFVLPSVVQVCVVLLQPQPSTTHEHALV